MQNIIAVLYNRPTLLEDIASTTEYLPVPTNILDNIVVFVEISERIL